MNLLETSFTDPRGGLNNIGEVQLVVLSEFLESVGLLTLIDLLCSLCIAQTSSIDVVGLASYLCLETDLNVNRAPGSLLHHKHPYK